MENELLILMHDDDEIEYLVLYEANRRRNLHVGLPYYKYDRFNLEDLHEDECEVEFRFKKFDIYRLAAALHFPNIFKCSNGVVVNPVEALRICLKRFTYPCRYADLVPRFGRPVPQLFMVTNLMVDYLYNRYSKVLHNFDQPWRAPLHLQMYADAIHNKGAALGNCWGFIDGTVRPICRPKEDQRMACNGHKRVHALKFQSIATPNGLITNLFGLVEGKRHDSGMLAMSGIMPQLIQMSFSPTGQAMCIYGDQAYPQRIRVQCPFPHRNDLTPAEQAVNQSLSQVRESVEWVFGDVVNYFKFTDFKKNLKIGVQLAK